MRGIITFANGSPTNIYGCIGYSIQEYLVSMFPRDYFKYTSVSTEVATRNIRRAFGSNPNVEISKRQKPYLFIQPTFTVQDYGDPMQGIMLTKNMDQLQYRTDRNYLMEILRDDENGYRLKYRFNRDRLEYDITLTVSTFHQQLDLFKMIQNQFIWDISFSRRMPLEAVIPKNLIIMASKLCNMDLTQYDSYIPLMNQRLNSHSAYPITYKMRTANSNDEWFMFYTHNVILTFSDLSLESGDRKNMTEDAYRITFRITADFNHPALYLLEGEQSRARTIDIGILSKSYESDPGTYIPIYAINNLYSKFPPEKDGMQLYGTTIFTTEGKGKLTDTVKIDAVIDNDHIRALSTHLSWKMSPDTLLKVYLLKNNVMLSQNTDFTVDWNKIEVVVKNPDDSATYRLVMYFNYLMVNDILSNTTYKNNYDIGKLPVNETHNSMDNNSVVTAAPEDDTTGIILTDIMMEDSVLGTTAPEGVLIMETTDPYRTIPIIEDEPIEPEEDQETYINPEEVINPSDIVNSKLQDPAKVTHYKK